MPHLIQILLPLEDNTGESFPPASFERVKRELAERFGGVTAFMQRPAEGVWTGNGTFEHDRVVTFEVMAEGLDIAWWKEYRRALELRFAQDVVVIRGWPVTLA